MTLCIQNTCKWLTVLLALGLICLSSACEEQSSDASSSTGDIVSQDMETGDTGDPQTNPDSSTKSTGSDPKEASSNKTATPEKQTVKTAQHGTLSGEPNLEVSNLVPHSALAQQVELNDFEQTELEGITPSPNYNALRLAPSKSDTLGITLQVWAPESAREKFDALKQQYLNQKPVELSESKTTRSAFTSHRAGIRTIVSLSKNAQQVFAISCDTQTCPEKQSLQAFLKILPKTDSDEADE